MRLLGCDVDLCICPSDKAWYRYLAYKQIGIDLSKGREYVDHVNKEASSELLPYDLNQMFPEVEDKYEYWRDLQYSQFQPIEGSVEALEKLSNYFGIVFISSVKGNHNKEKYYWLKEHFPFMVGYMATKEKYLMNDSVVAHIDDRVDVLEKFDYTKRILFKTNYTQTSEAKCNIEFDKWNDSIVHKICKEYL